MNFCSICKNAQSHSQWIQCEACQMWLHTNCVNLTQIEEINNYFCPSCIDTHGPITYKEKKQRKSNRNQERLNYADLNEGNSAGDKRIWKKILKAKSFKPDKFKRYQAKDININLLRETGFREPFVIETNEPELEMKMPPSDITVYDIARLVGGDDYPVEVIDVASQSEISGWTMGRWAKYYHNQKRDRIRNVISLEISGSELADLITRPKIVREMDWIDLMWPTELHPQEFPRVQLYCLMGTKDSYTDFHIDFGGSSVFYHILSGSKTFYFIDPSEKNLKKYKKWSSSPDQSVTFLGDEVKECYSVELKAGNTMLIPAGWIHAVYTPEDAIVIGGNFLQSFHIEKQIDVFEIEQETEVPLKFRFPFYRRLNWYALAKFDTWLKDPKTVTQLSYYELESMAVLGIRSRKEITKDEKYINNKVISQSLRKQYDIPEVVDDPIALSNRVVEFVRKTLQERDSDPSLEDDASQKPFIRVPVVSKPTVNKPNRKKSSAYVDDNNEFNSEGDDNLDPDDDDEYKSEYDDDNDEFMPKKKQETKVRQKKRASKVKIDNDSNSSSEDDSMGTSKPKSTDKISGLFSRRKRSLSNNANSQQKSSKQRLLERMSNSRKH